MSVNSAGGGAEDQVTESSSQVNAPLPASQNDASKHEEPGGIVTQPTFPYEKFNKISNIHMGL